MVCELDGPIPTLKMSKTLNDITDLFMACGHLFRGIAQGATPEE
jgi:hypothetical protein